MDESDINEITPEFVIEEIEKAARQREQEVESLTKRLESSESSFLKQLSEAIEEKSTERQKYSEKIAKIRYRIKADAEKLAGILATLLSSFCTLIIVVVLCILYWIGTEILKIGPLISLLATLFIGSGGLFGIWKQLRSKVKEQASNRIYRQKLHDIELDDSESI